MRLFNKLLLISVSASIPLYAATLLLLTLHDSRQYERQLATLTQSVQYELKLSGERLQREVSSSLTDFRFLSSGLNYEQMADPSVFRRIADSYLAFSRITGKYDQVRFLDAAGQERIRVNLTENGPQFEASADLQNKADRYYITALQQAEKEELYASPIDLNMEQGQIEIPHKPVIRMGLPIFSGTERVGMVVVNYLAKPILDSLETHRHSSAMLLNSEGYWLKAPNPADEWGFQLNNGRSFKERYPQAWQDISRQDNGVHQDDNGIFLFETIRPFCQTKCSACELPYWKLVHRISPDQQVSIRSGLLADTLIKKILIYLGSLLVTCLYSLTKLKAMAARTALRKSEEEYRELFANMMNGFALHEMIFDAEGAAVDYRFLKVNKAFESLTGLSETQLLGHTVKEVMPNTEAYWIQSFNQVLTSGKAVRLENYSGELQKHFEVYAYKVAETHFATIIKDVTLSRHAREAIEKQAQELQTVFDTTGAGLLLSDCHTRILDVNIACENLFGYTRAELIQKSYLDLVPENARDASLERLKLLRTGKNIDAVEVPGYTKDGRTLTLLINAHPTRNEQNEVTRFVISIVDITEHKKAEERAAALSERLTLATRAAQLGICDWNVKDDRLVWDERMHELYGLSKEKFNGNYQDWLDRLHPDDVARVTQEVSAALEGDTAFRTRFRIIQPDGATRHIRACADVYRDQAGKPIRMVGINWDITALIQAESHQLASENRYRFLSDAAHEAVILSKNGTIIEANQRFLLLTGKTKQELQEGIPLSSILNPDLLRTDQTITINLQPANSVLIKPVVAKVSLMHHEYKNEEVDVLVIRDISAQKETEEMLILAKMRAEAASRAKSEFLTTMSHELRTPMNGVMGMAQLLEETKLDEEQLEYVQTILDSSRSLLGIINDLLDLAGIEHGRVNLQKIPIDLYDTTFQVVELLTPQARSKEIELILTYDPNLPREFIGDEGRIRQILINLMGNAIKFTDTGSVTLRISPEAVSGEGLLIRIEVTDTGIGIPKEKLDVIFEKFTQVDQSDTRRYEGTGLGLNITKRLVELMDGSLTCESILNQGSTFTVILPLPLLAEEIPFEEHHAIERLPRSLKILLAEDNLTNRLTAEHLLQKMGCHIVNAINGKEALHMATEEEFDLILMDIQMPEMNGLEATLHIRSAGIKTPIIALTAHAMDTDHKTCIAAGMNDYLAKPIDQYMLLTAIKKIIQE